MDVLDNAVCWRWLHIGADGVLRKSTSHFSSHDDCAANASQHGWNGTLSQPSGTDAGAPASEGFRGSSLRYVAHCSGHAIPQDSEFAELVDVGRFVHKLPKGTVVRITDTRADVGQPSSYFFTSGDNAVGFAYDWTAQERRRRTG
jgi:hypothetical protein